MRAVLLSRATQGALLRAEWEPLSPTLVLQQLAPEPGPELDPALWPCLPNTLPLYHEYIQPCFPKGATGMVRKFWERQPG